MSLPKVFDDRKVIEVTRKDLAIASLAWGFTMGFGFLTTWNAMKQTALVHRRYGTSRLISPYIWMIWLEILISFILGITCWLHMVGVVPPRYIFVYSSRNLWIKLAKPLAYYQHDVVTCWSLEIQFLLQIIINRVSILLTCQRKARILKYSVATLITMVNISMYCTWIPGRLERSKKWEDINKIWDYGEKIIYLVVDVCLNLLFMYIIQENLVRKGLVKYDRLLRFNKCIIGFSISMDCLIIGTMSLQNPDVYVQFHPMAYMVKLNIEMSMTELMTKVSCSPNPSSGTRRSKKASFIRSDPNMNFETSPTEMKMYNQFRSTQEIVWREKLTLTDLILDHCSDIRPESNPECKFNLTREVHIQTEQRKSLQKRDGTEDSDQDSTEQFMAAFEDKFRRLSTRDIESASVQSNRMIPMKDDELGTQTLIWGPSK
ncbi:hypothetical protein OnM2_000020 [Erysiphe neolycopersici]|uniref:Uncharacterized protein n=1 Tax=Erysiphe neolycopersici TaxID=212602 RepID=A0A420I8I6_9PEZI|nr:hypothetical protein OnM2_000020 [Erysiphe neolycopersici]